MLLTLKDILKLEKTVAAFNVYGYEDAAAVIRAAEALGKPVILMTNKDAVNFIPIEVIGAMLVVMAKAAAVPVCVHLDHSRDEDDIRRAIASGYTSVMFDGSQLDIEENLRITKRVVETAHASGVSVEAEIGSVGYSDPSIQAKAEYTQPDQAVFFAEQTGVDALAVAIGTVHRMKIQAAQLDFDLLGTIRATVSVPLVIHGSSGVKDEDLAKMSEMGVNKINLGTSLRMTFGNTLRKTINENPDEFDRLKFFPASMLAVEEKAKEKITLLSR
ncbi:MAG: class II fructose-bisphosphate aldolase family protein [Oscillospiraceae bacterium]|nr:class II fructose-bisphosphate aldolase family protein [Oscillospiraceae bacterium]